MFSSVCFLLITALCWQHVTSRHLVQPNYHSLQQPYYLPYSDYGYTYSAASGPYQPAYPQPYQQPYPQSPLYSPPGTYFDQRRGILRPFPGGGVPVLVDYHKRCSNQYVGVKAHPEQHQYYYVCKPDCVIFGKCQNLQIFNNSSGQCAQNPPPEYIPTCTGVGRFPLFSDCHLYYKCEEDLQPKIYSCPAYMVFSPASKKCINGNKCTPTQISPRSSYIPEYCANKFPPCYENGIFRSPSDCSLYYKCDLQKNGVYMQTRLRCPNGNFYDLQKKECLPSEQVPCDCIQVAELVYPKPNSISYQPAVYPAQYDFDSLEENLYPVEQSAEEMNINCDIGETKSVSKNDSDVEEEVITTAVPETTLSNETNEQNDSEAVILSDYIDMTNDEPQSEETDQVAQNLITTTISSEETTSIEGSGSEIDSEETTTTITSEGENTTTSLDNNKTETDDAITDSITENEEVETTTTTITDPTGENEEVETTTTTSESSEEVTEMPDVLTEEPENETFKPTIEEENDITTTTTKVETTTTLTTVFANTTDIPSKPEPCENMVESDENNDKPLPTDIPSKDTSQTQTKTCLPRLTTTKSDTEPTRTTLVSAFTRGSRSTILEQNLTTITTTVTPTATTTQLPTTKMTTTTSDSLETTQVPEETPLDLEKDSLANEQLESNLLDSETSFETAETTQSSEKTTAATKETTNTPLADPQTSQEENTTKEEEVSHLIDIENELTTIQTPPEDNKQFTQTIHTRSVESSSLEDDVSYDDLSDNEITSNSLETTTRQPVSSTKLAEESSLEAEITQENDIASTDFPQESNAAKIDIGSTPLKNIESQENEKILETLRTSTESPQTTTVILDPTTAPLKPDSEESTNIPTDLDDEVALLDSEITIDDFESTTQIPEGDLNTNSVESEELLNASTLENEELLMVSPKQNDSSQEHKSLNEKSVTLRNADFSEEEFLPVDSKSTVMDDLTDQTTDFNYITDNFADDSDDDYTTVTGDKETTTVATVREEFKESAEISNSIEMEKTSTLKSRQKETTITPEVSQEQNETEEISNSIEMEKKDEDKTTTTILKRRQTSPEDTTQLTTVTPPIQITLTPDASATTTESSKATTNKEEHIDDVDSYDDILAVLDSEVILHDRSDEVSNNEITSAETTQTTSTAKQQFPNTHSTTFTPTQTPTTTPKYTRNTIQETTSEPCKKHSNTLVLHVREDDDDHEIQTSPSPLLDSPSPSKSLYYILKTKPVINKNNFSSENNINKSCNETVAAPPPCVEPENGKIPRLEIIAERPIDVHFSVCPSTCDKDHKHNYSPTGNRAVFLRWFANKSKQTMGFETVNEVNTSNDKDC